MYADLKSDGYGIVKDAHYLTFLVEDGGSDRGNPRLTAVLPRVMVRATVASHGFPRQGPRVSIVHGVATASATVVVPTVLLHLP